MLTGIPHFRTVRPSVRLIAGVAGSALALGVATPMPTASAAIDTGSIAGVVTDNGDAPVAVPGIQVRVWDNDGFGDVLVGQDVTDVTGAYQVDGVEVSPYYKVQFSDPAGDYATEYWEDSIAGPPYGTWVAVTAGNVTSHIDASLEPGSTISGKLTVGDGRPVEFGSVTLWWQNAPQSYTRLGTYSTDAEGSYSIPGVRGATYGLEFRDPATGASEAWNDRPSLLGSTPLVVPLGEDVTDVDALLGGVVKNVAAPTISGTPQVGQTLTAASGWQPSDASVTYRWVVGDDTTPADDPTGATYVPTAQDLGKTIRVHATATRGAGWVPASAWSAATSPVAAAPVVAAPVVVAPPLPALVNDRAPQIMGKLRVGKVLRVTKGSWSPEPEDFDFTWYAGGKVIKGADRQWFKLTKKQVGKRLRVVVTVSAPSFVDTSVRTKRTDRVKS